MMVDLNLLMLALWIFLLLKKNILFCLFGEHGLFIKWLSKFLFFFYIKNVDVFSTLNE